MPSVRERALVAAMELVGTQGVRALTHGRVDDVAAIPKGSTSNYFRTRNALVAGVVEEVVRTEREAIGQTVTFAPASVEDFVEGFCSLIDYLTGPLRSVTSARLALFLEAAHDDAVRTMIQQGREGFEALTVVALTDLGAPNPQVAARTMMACADGIILHRIVRDDTADARPMIAAVAWGLWARR